jgi:hypothetical protein
MKFDEETLLRNVDKNHFGVFFLFKAVFVNESEDDYIGSERCDNLSYGVSPVVHGTPYEYQSFNVGGSSKVSDFTFTVTELKRFEHVIEALPNYYITYMEIVKKVNGVEIIGASIEDDPTPQMMWVGKNFHHLLKIMREWSFMLNEPFNSDHPMAEYSKKFFDHTQPPQNILDEIDSYPDMQLAKFLKVQDDYRKIPEFPDMSEDMKQWVLEIAEMYGPK